MLLLILSHCPDPEKYGVHHLPFFLPEGAADPVKTFTTQPPHLEQFFNSHPKPKGLANLIENPLGKFWTDAGQ